MGNRVFVGVSAADKLNRAHFESCGEITDAVVVKDRDTGRSKGFGFVTFANDDSASNAIDNLDGGDMGGRSVRSAKHAPSRAAPEDAPHNPLSTSEIVLDLIRAAGFVRFIAPHSALSTCGSISPARSRALSLATASFHRASTPISIRSEFQQPETKGDQRPCKITRGQSAEEGVSRRSFLQGAGGPRPPAYPDCPQKPREQAAAA